MIPLNRSLPAPVTSQMALQHLRELRFERCGLPKLPTASTFAQKSASPMDQLLAFATVLRWLFAQIGGNLAQFSEFDEPNAISMEIITASRQFIQIENLAPHDLRSGSGDAVCSLLLAVCEAVLQKKPARQLEWKTKQETFNAVREEDDDKDDEQDTAFEEAMMHTFQAVGGKQQAQTQIAPGVQDAIKWQEECLHVEPQLASSKFQVSNDWRPDILKLSSLNLNLQAQTGTIHQQLQIVADQLDKQIEMLQQRESFLNQQISQFSGKLLECSRKHSSLQKEADDIVKEIENLTEQLQDATEKCKKVKQEMNIESQRINDASSVSYAKQAIAQLNTEIRDLDLKIVLAQQRLFQYEQK
ncbi:Intraflagellar_transport protein 57 [Hexamita inflata]|uniref:Intraflagellar transport protein 57 n=1 Tax=Hexamita inflata TaxID=28002 RepID=A0AA86Q698_9EUKA|nr:Intraflagellar transport protein 57 [Hexamita inflata]CAI9951538.1 Intraflagellar transport protein 57 [Hexamita inflata]